MILEAAINRKPFTVILPYYNKITDGVSYKVNIARAMAALFVMLVHIRTSIFLPYKELSPASANLVNYALFFITRIGHECVLVFFVLSGFLVGGQAVAEHFKGGFNVKRYFINRCSRMWAVVIPALLLGWFVDAQTLMLDHSLDFGYKLTVPIFLGNVFFTQTILVPAFGSNVPLWSLAYEFWYYLMFPLYFFLCVGNIPKALKVVLLVVVSAALCHFLPEMMKLFPLWLFGIFIRFIPPVNFLKGKYAGYVLFFILILSIAYSAYAETLLANYLMGVVFSANILCWMNQGGGLNKGLFSAVIDGLAKFSFTLYAIHYFILYYIVTLLQKRGYALRYHDANFANWLLCAGIAIIMLAISYLFYWLFEKRTFVLRKWMSQLLLKN